MEPEDRPTPHRAADARRRELLNGIAEAEDALKAANLRTFRDAMRALFARRPELASVRFNQTVTYDDEFFAAGVNDLWVNDLYFYTNESILGDYRMDHVADHDDDGFYAYSLVPQPAPQLDPVVVPPGSYRDPAWEEEVKAAYHDQYGALAETAQDVTDTLRGLRERYSRHFYWDVFGLGAAVEVTRDEIRVTDDVVSRSEESRATDPAYLGPDWSRRYLGAPTLAYLTSPERSPHLAVRDALRAELRRLHADAVLIRLYEAASAIRSPRAHPLGVTLSDGHIKARRVSRVTVRGHEIRVGAARESGALYPYVPVPPRGTPMSVEEAYAHLRETLGAEAAEAVRRWLDVLTRLRADYGADAFAALDPHGEQTLRF